MQHPDLTKRQYKIGEVAQLTGLPLSTLRFYEREGLIKPRRGPKGTRHYTPADIERLRIASFLTREKGMSLEAARRHLEANPESVDHRPEVIERLRALRARLQAIYDALP